MGKVTGPARCTLSTTEHTLSTPSCRDLHTAGHINLGKGAGETVGKLTGLDTEFICVPLRYTH